MPRLPRGTQVPRALRPFAGSLVDVGRAFAGFIFQRSAWSSADFCQGLIRFLVGSQLILGRRRDALLAGTADRGAEQNKQKNESQAGQSDADALHPLFALGAVHRATLFAPTFHCNEVTLVDQMLYVRAFH